MGSKKRKAKTTISWEDSTDLVKFWKPDHVTMARFVGGAPLDKDIKTISHAAGERVSFHIEKIGNKEVVGKINIEIARFAHEPLPPWSETTAPGLLKTSARPIKS